MTVSIEELSPYLGAEISGVNLLQPLREEEFRP